MLRVYIPRSGYGHELEFHVFLFAAPGPCILLVTLPHSAHVAAVPPFVAEQATLPQPLSHCRHDQRRSKHRQTCDGSAHASGWVGASEAQTRRLVREQQPHRVVVARVPLLSRSESPASCEPFAVKELIEHTQELVPAGCAATQPVSEFQCADFHLKLHIYMNV